VKVEESNKIIAEYMGLNFLGYDKDIDEMYIGGSDPTVEFEETPYTSSLDALVPAWEKLNNLWTRLDFLVNDTQVEIGYMHSRNSKSGYGKQTIQESAAIATAKAILELNK